MIYVVSVRALAMAFIMQSTNSFITCAMPFVWVGIYHLPLRPGSIPLLHTLYRHIFLIRTGFEGPVQYIENHGV